MQGQKILSPMPCACFFECPGLSSKVIHYCRSISAALCNKSKICSTGPTIRHIQHCIQMFWKKPNNCWETKLYKNDVCLLFTSLQIHFWQLYNLDILAAGLPYYGFVINKQMAYFQIFVSQQLLFLFSKYLDTMLNVTDCGTSRTYLWSQSGYNV